MSKSWPKMIALIITHIQMYEVMKLRDLNQFKDVFFRCEKKCLVRNRCEYFNMIEIMFGCNVDIMF